MAYTDIKEKNARPFVSAVIVAAGNSTRMGRDKIMADLCGLPVIVRTVRAFCECDDISEIIIVTAESKIAQIGKLCKEYNLDKVAKIVKGSSERMGSVLRGLNHVDRKCKFAAIHDGARPLVSKELITRVVELAVRNGAAAPGVPPKDTIKSLSGGVISKTIERGNLICVQTPQAFDIALIRGALVKASEDNFICTDDCMAVEHIGGVVSVCSGEYENIKLTTPEDIYTAREIIKRKGVPE